MTVSCCSTEQDVLPSSPGLCLPHVLPSSQPFLLISILGSKQVKAASTANIILGTDGRIIFTASFSPKLKSSTYRLETAGFSNQFSRLGKKKKKWFK